jgi:hypothetical protein
VDVDPPDAATIQAPACNQRHHLMMLDYPGLGQTSKQAENLRPIAQIPARQLADDEGVRDDIT